MQNSKTWYIRTNRDNKHNSLTNDEKFFLRHHDSYSPFNHFNYLKLYRERITENILFDYKQDILKLADAANVAL
jgi:hypothetical protein